MSYYLVEAQLLRKSEVIVQQAVLLLKDPDNFISKDPRNEFDCIQSFFLQRNYEGETGNVLNFSSHGVMVVRTVSKIEERFVDKVSKHCYYVVEVEEDDLPFPEEDF